MNTYEVLFIFKPILDVDNSDKVLQSIEDAIQNLKGKVVRKDKLGRKRLAYEIDKFKDGFITSMILQMEPSAIKEFKRICQLNEDVLRMTLLRQDKFDLENLPEVPDVRTERPERRDERPGGPRGRGPRPPRFGDREGRPEGRFEGRPEGRPEPRPQQPEARP